MKKLVFLLVFVVVATTCQTVYAQTAQMTKKLSILDDQISQTEKELLTLKKELEKEKKIEIFELRKKSRGLEKEMVERKAKTIEERDAMVGRINDAKGKVALINQEIDSITSIMSTWEIEEVNTRLQTLKERKREMLLAEIDNEKLPKEMRVLEKNRRSRANIARREEIVLSKIEANVASEINPSSSEGGYKIIFDNKYSLNTTFIVRGIDGGQRLAISLPPKTRERHYLVPGRYVVEYIVGGRKMQNVDRLTVDGEKHFYESEPCFGFVYKSRL